jgi:hypothetical protein
LQHIPHAEQSRAADSEKAELFILEKAFDPQISDQHRLPRHNRVQGTHLRMNCDEVIFDTLPI